jgi:hypothetical protein
MRSAIATPGARAALLRRHRVGNSAACLGCRSGGDASCRSPGDGRHWLPGTYMGPGERERRLNYRPNLRVGAAMATQWPPDFGGRR